MGARHPAQVLAALRGAALYCPEAPMVTVEVDPVRVESRLAAGEIGCSRCGGVLGGWGHARARWITGVDGPLRPRQARCRSCRATHVLLPVTVLLRRAYAAERIWAALRARASGWGHRRIGAAIRVPAATARGWLRRASDRLEALRVWFLQVAVSAGVDVAIPNGSGCGWRDALAAVEAAAAAIISRFGAIGLLGAVTPPQVVVAASGGRLLAPGWTAASDHGDATRIAPEVLRYQNHALDAAAIVAELVALPASSDTSTSEPPSSVCATTSLRSTTPSVTTTRRCWRWATSC